MRASAVLEPRPGLVLVRVEATSVNPIDVKRAGGYGRRLLGLKGAGRFPLVLGNDFAGRVEAVGQQLVTKAVVPFELATALLIVAVVGAIAVARSRHQPRKQKQSPSPTRRFFHGPLHPRDAGRPLTGEEHYVLLSAVIFTIGSIGFLVRRNVLVQLMSIELMLNAVNLALVAFNRRHVGDMNGQVFSFFIIAVAAAEAAVGLAIVLSFYRLKQSVFSDDADQLRL